MADESFFRKDRASTGIKELDIILEGGYPNIGTTLLLAPADQEKLAFTFHFVSAGIKAGEKVIYIALDMSPEEIENKANAFGLAFNKHTNNELVFIDAYSQVIHTKETGRKDIMISSPAALNDLSLALNDIISQANEKHIRLVLHSLSTFTLYSQFDTIIKFLQVMDGKLRNANATCFWLVDEGMHDMKFIAAIETMCDFVLHISNKEGMHELTATGIPFPIPIKLGMAGLEVL